jgi:hypothetical protein
MEFSGFPRSRRPERRPGTQALRHNSQRPRWHSLIHFVTEAVLFIRLLLLDTLVFEFNVFGVFGFNPVTVVGHGLIIILFLISSRPMNR